jgi:type III pantothenate kinase
MLLVVDVGNTQTVVGLLAGDEVVDRWRIATVRHRTSDEIAGLLQGFFSLRGMRFADDVHAVGIASVVPGLTKQWSDMCRTRLGIEAFVVGPGARTGMHIAMKNPTEVGADRIVNAVAAVERYGAPVVIVDFGTSTNFDVVNAEGEYVGGVIAPGVEVSMEALTTRAARLVGVDITAPEHAIGKDTIEAMQAGAVYGFAGQVDGIARAIWDELGASTRLIATGGLATLIAPYSATISEVDADLTLRGIRLVMSRQQRV